jgi:hypothetical protein
MKRALILVLVCALPLAAAARGGGHGGHGGHSAHHAHPRSRAVTREFQRLNPCPSTGRTTGACPGWVKDHKDPLCNGGADAVWNMQWQTEADAARKDDWERQLCRRKR